MVINRQRRMRLPAVALNRFVQRLKSALSLKGREFNVCFMDDEQIRRLNARFRGKACPTDVLSFPWHPAGRDRALDLTAPRPASQPDPSLGHFLGDIAISVEAARRNAQAEGHSVQQEFCWLILHGVLHLLGFDHEADQGEMTALEIGLRARLGLDGLPRRRGIRAQRRAHR
jgi:probable rRNA maturation factor